jgi:hypothetical protein
LQGQPILQRVSISARYALSGFACQHAALQAAFRPVSQGLRKREPKC